MKRKKYFLDFEKRRIRNNIETLFLKKIMPLVFFVLITIYMGYLIHSIINYGFGSCKEFYYQAFSAILLTTIIIYTIYDFKRKKIFINHGN